jgi:hypothetical protein
MKHFRLALLLGSFWPACTDAQNFAGLAASRYAGIHQVYSNPALIAGSPYRVQLNLLAGNANIYNNYADWAGPYRLSRLVFGGVPDKYLNSDGGPAFEPEYFRENLNGKSKNITGWAEVRGPGALFDLGQGNSLAITTRMRAAVQGFGLSENLLSLIRQGFDLAALWNVTNVDNAFTVNGNAYGEIALTYAGTLSQQGPHVWKAGFTVKKLVGFYSAHIRNRGLSYRVVEDPDRPGRGLFVLDKMDLDFGYTDQEATRGGLNLRKFLGSKMPGSGWGADLGISYEYQPEEDGDYTLRLSASVLDLGAVRYEDKEQIRGYNVQRENRTIRQEEFDGITGSDELVRFIETKMELQPSEAKTRFTSGLPTALNLQADIRMGDMFYLGATYIRDLRAANAISMRQPTMLTVTPRWEFGKGLEIALPVHWIFQTLSPGVAVRLGPAFAGTDNLIGLFGSGSRIAPKGMDLYAGLTVPLGKPASRK